MVPDIVVVMVVPAALADVRVRAAMAEAVLSIYGYQAAQPDFTITLYGILLRLSEETVELEEMERSDSQEEMDLVRVAEVVTVALEAKDLRAAADMPFSFISRVDLQ